MIRNVEVTIRLTKNGASTINNGKNETKPIISTTITIKFTKKYQLLNGKPLSLLTTISLK